VDNVQPILEEQAMNIVKRGNNERSLGAIYGTPSPEKKKKKSPCKKILVEYHS